MKFSEFLKDVGIPLISVGTAVMVGILNFQVNTNDQELRKRDQDLTKKVSEIDLLVKKSKEERAERESNQNFNIKIYDIVTKSLEEGDSKKQEAAKAFIVVMVEEPLRSSLLGVLKQGSEPEVKAGIGRIIEQEKKFQSSVSTAPEKTHESDPSYNWGEWDIDIFWCSSSGEKVKAQARAIGEQLVAEGAKGRIRIRELPESINAKSGYQIDGYAIRRNSNEKEVSDALKILSERVLKNRNLNVEFSVGVSLQSTPWYVSIFLCPES